MAGIGFFWTGSVWSYDWGGPCEAQLQGPGIGATHLAADPAFPAPEASTRNLRLLVFETRCNSGKPIGDRLRGPIVEETNGEVRIAFGVVPRPGDQDCPSNPPLAVTIRLTSPLGNRVVENAAIFPFRALEKEW